VQLLPKLRPVISVEDSDGSFAFIGNATDKFTLWSILGCPIFA
jgi:hypothetical protein